MCQILVVEDESVLARTITKYFERKGYVTRYATTYGDARSEITKTHPPLVLLDYRLGANDGLDILRWMRDERIPSKVVMMTAHGDIEVAVEAMKLGAHDFLVKPMPLTTLASIASNILQAKKQGEISDPRGISRIVGSSHVANNLRKCVQSICKEDGLRLVLIEGQHGAGKLSVALAIHECCFANDPVEIIDYENPESAGFVDDFDGRSEGTLIVRSIDKLSKGSLEALLSKLSRAPVNFRLLGTAANIPDIPIKNLSQLTSRIDCRVINVPPLIARQQDIPTIASSAATLAARDSDNDLTPAFTTNARAKLLSHKWPGNVSELEECVRNAILTSETGEIDEDDLQVDDANESMNVQRLENLEILEIKKALRLTGGNVSNSARLLGISRDTLRYRMKKFNLGIE